MCFKLLFYRCFTVLLLSLIWLPANAEIELSFGTYTSDKPTTMVKKFRPVINALEKELEEITGEKVKIKLHISRNYQKGIEDIVSGKVDFARLGPASYIEAKHKSPGIKLIAMESKKGKKRFNGVICIRKDSEIKQLTDLRGRSFAFGNQKSTIGRYLSQALLVKNFIFAKDLKNFEYLGRHDKVAYSVANGQFDAGALKESTFKKVVKKGKSLKALVTFENITKPWVMRSNFPESLFKKIQSSLLNIRDKKALKLLKKDGFLVGSDSEYDVVRDAIKNNKEFFYSDKTL